MPYYRVIFDNKTSIDLEADNRCMAEAKAKEMKPSLMIDNSFILTIETQNKYK
jgi:hypothetical protein